MAEPEFVLVDDVPATGPEAMPLKRAGKHAPAAAVLVDLHAHPRARRTVTRLLVLVVLGAAVGAAIVTFRKRRSRIGQDVPSPTLAAVEHDMDDVVER